MTVKELTTILNNRFMFEMACKDVLMEAERVASQLARVHWPEVHSVSASFTYDYKQEIQLSLVFKSEQDYVWWKLKYE